MTKWCGHAVVLVWLYCGPGRALVLLHRAFGKLDKDNHTLFCCFSRRQQPAWGLTTTPREKIAIADQTWCGTNFFGWTPPCGTQVAEASMAAFLPQNKE